MRNSIHLAIDAVGVRRGGGMTVLNSLLNAAIEDSRIAKISLFCSPVERRVGKIPVSSKLIELPAPWIDKIYAFRIIWYEWLTTPACRRIGADALLLAANFGHVSSGLPCVTYIQQSLPFSNKAMKLLNWNGRITNIIRRVAMRRSCRSADRVICQSTVMKNLLIEDFHLVPAKVVSVYPSPMQFTDHTNMESSPLNKGRSSRGPRLLYVGDDYPYKQLDLAIEGTQLIRHQLPGAEFTLTLSMNHHYASIPGVKCVGYLNKEQLASAYQSTDILVLPSLTETVGLPVLEAMSVGTPALAADVPYAHDMFGDAALFFDPLSPQDFADKSIRLLQDQELRQTLIKRGYELVEKRQADKPYERIIDICVEIALEARRKRGFV